MITFLADFVSIAVPVIAGFVGAFTGGWLSGYRDRSVAKRQFAEKQLQLLYSPILGLLTGVRARNALSSKVAESANRLWKEGCAEAQERGGSLSIESFANRNSEAYTAFIDYDNEKLLTDVLPSFRRICDLLRDLHYLAEPSTREHYTALFAYIDLWDRSLAKAVPAEVIKDLRHDGKVVDLFYEEILQVHDSLRDTLKAGKPPANKQASQ